MAHEYWKGSYSRILEGVAGTGGFVAGWMLLGFVLVLVLPCPGGRGRNSKYGIEKNRTDWSERE